MRNYQAVIDGTLVLPKFGFGRWEAIATVSARSGSQNAVCWIPSHGKKEGWQAPAIGRGTTEEWRALNAIADKEADRGREHAEAFFGHDDWATRRAAKARQVKTSFNRLLHGVGDFVLDSPHLTGLWTDAFKGATAG